MKSAVVFLALVSACFAATIPSRLTLGYIKLYVAAEAYGIVNTDVTVLSFSGWVACPSNQASCTPVVCHDTNQVTQTSLSHGQSVLCNLPTFLPKVGSLTLRSSVGGTITGFVQWGADNQPNVADAITAGQWDCAGHYPCSNEGLVIFQCLQLFDTYNWLTNGFDAQVGRCPGTTGGVTAAVCASAQLSVSNVVGATASTAASPAASGAVGASPSTSPLPNLLATVSQTISSIASYAGLWGATSGATVNVQAAVTVTGGMRVTVDATLNVAAGGAVSVTGYAILEGSLIFNANSLTPTAISVTGAATVGGSLTVNIAAGVTFTTGSTITVMSYSSLAGGSFTSVTVNTGTGTRGVRATVPAYVDCSGSTSASGSCVVTGGTRATSPASSSSSTPVPDAINIGVGVGIGLGVPLVILAILIAYCVFCKKPRAAAKVPSGAATPSTAARAPGRAQRSQSGSSAYGGSYYSGATGQSTGTSSASASDF